MANKNYPEVPTRRRELASYTRNQIEKGWRSSLTKIKNLHFSKITNNLDKGKLKEFFKNEDMNEDEFKLNNTYTTRVKTFGRITTKLVEPGLINENSFIIMDSNSVKKSKRNVQINAEDTLVFTRIFAKRFEIDVPYVELKYCKSKEPSRCFKYKFSLLSKDGTLSTTICDFMSILPSALLKEYDNFIFCLPSLEFLRMVSMHQ